MSVAALAIDGRQIDALNPPGERLTALLDARVRGYGRLASGPFEVRRLTTHRRRNSTLHTFSIIPPHDEPDLLVKIPWGSSDCRYAARRDVETYHDRPRLFPRIAPEEKPRYEYAALRHIESHLGKSASGQIDVVRVFDFLEDEQALVMQWINAPDLRSQLANQHRFAWGTRRRDLTPALTHAGRWLRSYHGLPSLPHTTQRATGRDDLLAAADRFIGYLARHSGQPSGFARLQLRLEALARRCVPRELPAGLVHGDFAPRNVFVDANQRVTVIDTLARFRAPVYEDICHMIIALQTSGPRLVTGDLLYDESIINRYEQAFLQGYFHDSPIPWPALRAVQVTLMLESWCAIVHRHREATGWKRVAKSLRRQLWHRSYQRYTTHLLSATPP